MRLQQRFDDAQGDEGDRGLEARAPGMDWPCVQSVHSSDCKAAMKPLRQRPFAVWSTEAFRHRMMADAPAHLPGRY